MSQPELVALAGKISKSELRQTETLLLTHLQKYSVAQVNSTMQINTTRDSVPFAELAWTLFVVQSIQKRQAQNIKRSRKQLTTSVHWSDSSADEASADDYDDASDAAAAMD